MLVGRPSAYWDNVVEVIDDIVANGIENRIEEALFCRGRILVAHLHGEMEIISAMRSERRFGYIQRVDTNLVERLHQVDLGTFRRPGHLVNNVIRWGQGPDQGLRILVASAKVLHMSLLCRVFLVDHVRRSERQVCRRLDDTGTQLEVDICIQGSLVMLWESIKRGHPRFIDLDGDMVIDCPKWR